jgi:hypothetical protein
MRAHQWSGSKLHWGTSMLTTHVMCKDNKKPRVQGEKAGTYFITGNTLTFRSTEASAAVLKYPVNKELFSVHCSVEKSRARHFQVLSSSYPFTLPVSIHWCLPHGVKTPHRSTINSSLCSFLQEENLYSFFHMCRELVLRRYQSTLVLEFLI